MSSSVHLSTFCLHASDSVLDETVQDNVLMGYILLRMLAAGGVDKDLLTSIDLMRFQKIRLFAQMMIK